MTTESPIALHSPDQSSEWATLSTDSVFHLLQNSRRRSVIEYFLENEGPVSLGTLADWVAARECEATPEEVPGDARQRVYISLYQSHLPKLDDNGVVTYDKADNTIARASNATALEGPIEFERQASRLQGDTATDDERSHEFETDDSEQAASATVGWAPYYLGIVFGGFLSVAATWLFAIPSSVLSLQALNLVLVGLYTLAVVGNLLRPDGPF